MSHPRPAARRFLPLSAALALALSGVQTAAAQTTLSALFMKQAAYSEADVRAMTAAFQKANPGIVVNLEFVPYEGLREKTVAAQASGGYDVVLFDVIWPAEYAKNGFLQDVTGRVNKADVPKIFPGAWTTVQLGNRYYGLPWILDTKYLFYNTAMLKKAGIGAPPRTMEELLAQARIIKQKGLARYPIVSSWSQAEALVADYTMYVSAFGGQFLDAAGQPAFNTGGGLRALEFMVQTVKEGLTNPNSREYLEEDVRRVFSGGQAAFALNWTYMYALTQDKKESKVVGQVGIVPAPGARGGAKVSAVNGSMGLGITAGSKNPDAAWKYISYLTSRPVQEQYAKLSLPIWKASYSSPAVTRGQEAVVKAAGASIGAMYPRPVVPQYQEVSTILQKALQRALLGQVSPEAALDDAARQVAALK
ncbi:extracellular solute-binding protein [Deinococcus koreensis]|uniref:ABC transporter substrate-binding protein n=1 Tax=Deinococcus koreensis TaxID=2054903 RepID=A0A2K3UT11_9DEIO|nr:extracellular solute-binding protein [Deinococcus koreensis]PNY79650.1 ABC transporter substrate-binding protein [Deinococcus koreensis]